MVSSSGGVTFGVGKVDGLLELAGSLWICLLFIVNVVTHATRPYKEDQIPD